MNRPVYETQHDLTNERIFCDKMLEKFNLHLYKVPNSYKTDFFMWDKDEKFLGIVEYKRRNMKWGQYPTIMLSVLKLYNMLSIVNVIGGNAYFVVETNDGLYKCGDFSSLKIVYGGRTLNTRDSADIEPIAEIPLERFEKIL